MKRVVLVLTVCVLSSFAGAAETGVSPARLRCEYRINPLGIDVVKPRLNWIVLSDAAGQKQTAYRILAATSPEKLTAHTGDLWDSGEIKSDQTTHVVYNGKQLTSGMRCFWKVRIRGANGKASYWSKPASWSMGLLKPSDWKAKWIAAQEDSPASEAGVMPATMLRKSFKIAGPIKRATVHVSGLGVYDLHINGKKVGDSLLAPGFTMYRSRVQYQTFDVTKMLAEGDNAAGAILSDGWNGEYFFGMPMRQTQRPFEGRRGFIMQLEVELAAGKTQMILSDKSWRSTRNGPMRVASLYDGERYDGRMAMPGWDKPGFDDKRWNQAVLATYLDKANLVWRRNEPIRVVRELKPVKLTEPKPGVFVFDMGQNMVGWCRLKVNGRAGTSVKLVHGEMLNEDGTVYTANLRGALQTDVFIKGVHEAQTYEPKFTYHGFRYVQLTGNEYKPWRYMPPYKPRITDLVGRVFHSASPQAGQFECSSELINKINQMVVWVQRGNMHSVPTDCPQRCERGGWMGDIQSFAQTAIFNMDMSGFFCKWIPDVRDSQNVEGPFSNFAPMDHGRWKGGTPAWSDAGVIVPWRVYQNYGDVRMLAEHYESARRWVDYVYKNNPNLLWERRHGDNFNDWLNGDTIIAEGWPTKGGRVPPRVLASAFFYYSTNTVAKMAAVIGRADEAKKYAARAAGIKAAFNKKYVKSDGTIEGNTQAGCALALRFDLLPENVRPKAAAHMVADFKRYKGHMSTGIQTSHRLMLELTRNGYNDEAYRLLNMREFPSWGFMLDQGATTIWERWDGYVKGRGFQKPLMNSFNHWALGAVGEWMWRNIVGLNPDEAKPGWKHFIVAPRPGGGLTWARGSYKSIRGEITSAWRIEGGKFSLDVTVPPNTTATVRLPAKYAKTVTVNSQLIAQYPKRGFEVGSGRHKFAASIK